MASFFSSASLFVIVGICLMLIGIITIFFHNKLNEQNKKITVLFDIIYLLKSEIATVVTQSSQTLQMGGTHVAPTAFTSTPTASASLMQVSDDEDEEDEDSDDEDENSDDEDENSDDEGDVDNENSDDDEDAEVKIIKFNLNSSGIEETEFETENVDVEDIDEGVVDLDEFDQKKEDEEQMRQEAEFQEQNMDNTTEIDIKNIFLNKNASATTMHTDYKKMSLNELKSIAIEKNLITAQTKLKKGELLHLLQETAETDIGISSIDV